MASLYAAAFKVREGFVLVWAQLIKKLTIKKREIHNLHFIKNN
jgi:hypothetical protein